MLLLYGSRARGEARTDSDVDLLLALPDNELLAPTATQGVSLHRYPQSWLEKSARAGTLFSYHVAFEGLALEDSDDFLGRLRGLFVAKSNYEDEVTLGALVMRLLLDKDWGANFAVRRRFFWALRTVLIAHSTRVGAPQFDSDILEKQSEIAGVAALINGREVASFEACRQIGLEVLEKLNKSIRVPLSGQALRDQLMTQGGIGRDSVRILEEGEAISDMGLLIYL
ncbi:nucleotidyltransferase domain-containing protein [Brevundimonas mediterranea]|uniref:Polymerase nucleotidyl transferase domain-containing protein n=1 Tax=Brevundimonas mediterranea TaxID=74329 RepID=A0A7W6A3V6_9CAUL|nr:hypothetical protein [Brevundimonas mediterranea]